MTHNKDRVCTGGPERCLVVNSTLCSWMTPLLFTEPTPGGSQPELEAQNSGSRESNVSYPWDRGTGWPALWSQCLPLSSWWDTSIKKASFLVPCYSRPSPCCSGNFSVLLRRKTSTLNVSYVSYRLFLRARSRHEEAGDQRFCFSTEYFTGHTWQVLLKVYL